VPIADDVQLANIFHWIIDWLPRLAFLGPAARKRDVFVATSPLTAKFQWETLRLCGVDADRIITVGNFEAIQARDWAFFPPLGKRSLGGGAAFDPNMWGSVPGGYRNTINDNVVLILMIETLEGLKNADEIAKVQGVHAIFAASSDLGNFAGYRQGDPDYEREINIVHDAAIKAGVKLCGPWAWRDRPDFTCFQAGSEMAAIARGAKAELGEYADTQAKPEVGPFATTARR
jgi:hypothetical protein